VTTPVDELRTAAAREADSYRGGFDVPLSGYGRIVAVYGAAVMAAGAVTRRRKVKLPEHVAPLDLVLVGAATAKLSRLVAREPVTSPLRAPFTELRASRDRRAPEERPRGHGTRHALGELLTCPFCVSQWFATGFAFGLVTSPRLTRQVAGLFAALEVADLLQYLRSGAEKLTQ
jgi:hypothetical protein